MTLPISLIELNKIQSLVSPTRKFLRESPATAVIKGKKTKAVVILLNDILLIVDPKFKLIERIELNDTSNLELPVEEGEAGKKREKAKD